ncbi:Crp/Fnr family transcriptional regulator [Pontibacter diazotrophicus]|uniref:Crp/Fnr family transcriptional regulator n=1 Tax=Pontibacter diazotrophicus TaxID=1400979 RepID=A0A3D8L3A7_9BACT|nr:Crp/Fnr family transcriptional regulator [Pontibacter diazotrophicus]RDV11860.1 Crp/Fnr family transcriptional regulator [Pontibacter diazotrophicus]
MTELEKYIQTYFGVGKDDLIKISAFFKPLTLNKGDFFLKTGRYSDRLGFVQSGIIREFVHIDNKEVTKWISTKGYFAVDLSSFYFHQPARWNIQALTDCELYVIDSNDYQKIGQVIPLWRELEKLFIAKCFTVLEDRIVQHLSMSAEERYSQLFNFNKELFNQVPLKYLASMLGITPETLSRLRKNTTNKTS